MENLYTYIWLVFNIKNNYIFTGTPVQNKVRDLWALIDWITQGSLLGTQKTFRSNYGLPIERARQRVGALSQKNQLNLTENVYINLWCVAKKSGAVTKSLMLESIYIKLGSMELNGHNFLSISSKIYIYLC